jgi:fructose-specific phosphotransferase system IIA component
MALTEFLRQNLIFLDLHPKDMRECLATMVSMAADTGVIDDRDDALQRLLDRERTMSTGMGGGVAVPHAKSERCHEMIVAMARVPDGIDFKAIDGKPVYVVFMLLGPPDSTRQHVDLLARIAYLVKTPGVVDAIQEATNTDHILEALKVGRHDSHDHHL